MNNDKVIELVKQLDGISYLEWQKIHYIVETHFSRQKGKLEREIKLSSENAILAAETEGVIPEVKTVLLSQKQI